MKKCVITIANHKEGVFSVLADNFSDENVKNAISEITGISPLKLQCLTQGELLGSGAYYGIKEFIPDVPLSSCNAFYSNSDYRHIVHVIYSIIK